MNVLVACEFSGVVRDAFIRKGHNAISCDLIPSEAHGPHIQGNAISALYAFKWDLVIAHPPCTYLCNSGVRWLETEPGRKNKMRLAAEFFNEIFIATTNVPKLCVENPIMHRYAMALIGKEYTQIIQPWMFGHMRTKATCLWLRGLPPLVPTDNVKEAMLKLPKKERDECHNMSPGKDRGKKRSVTYSGIAEAMAEQWGSSK